MMGVRRTGWRVPEQSRRRRVAVVALTVMGICTVMAASAGNASAACNPSVNELGDASVDVAPAKVAVDGGNNETRVCVSPGNRETTVRESVNTTWLGNPSVYASAESCDAAGCTGVGNTGVTLGPAGWTYIDPPADGDGTYGVTVTAGNGVCASVNGTPTSCQGGGTYGGVSSGGEVYPPSVHPAVDPLIQKEIRNVYWLYPFTEFCYWSMFQGYTVVDVWTTCAKTITWAFTDPILALL
jgi:hypothetical protein